MRKLYLILAVGVFTITLGHSQNTKKMQRQLAEKHGVKVGMILINSTLRVDRRMTDSEWGNQVSRVSTFVGQFGSNMLPSGYIANDYIYIYIVDYTFKGKDKGAIFNKRSALKYLYELPTGRDIGKTDSQTDEFEKSKAMAREYMKKLREKNGL